MSAHRLTNWLIALAIVGIYIAMAFIDGPTDHSAEQAQAKSMADAMKAEAEAERFARASATLCGNENAAVRDLGDGTIQCLTKRGHKTIKVAL